MRGKKFKEVFSRDFIRKIFTATGHDMITVWVDDGEIFVISDLLTTSEEEYKKYWDMEIQDWVIAYGTVRILIKEEK